MPTDRAVSHNWQFNQSSVRHPILWDRQSPYIFLSVLSACHSFLLPRSVSYVWHLCLCLCLPLFCSQSHFYSPAALCSLKEVNNVSYQRCLWVLPDREPLGTERDKVGKRGKWDGWKVTRSIITWLHRWDFLINVLTLAHNDWEDEWRSNGVTGWQAAWLADDLRCSGNGSVKNKETGMIEKSGKGTVREVCREGNDGGVARGRGRLWRMRNRQGERE